MALLRWDDSPHTSVMKVNAHEAAKVILDPEIYDRITDDNSPQLTELDLAKLGVDYFGGYVDDKIVAVTTFERFREGVKVHFQVLKDYRHYARDLLEKSLSGQSGAVYAHIPACFMTTINFAKHQGFKLVNIEPKCYLKYGANHDRHLLKREIPCHS